MRGKRGNARFEPRVRPNAFSAQGWADYLAQRPFPADYDAWDQISQRHYERGRLRAAGAFLIYRRIPPQEPANIVRRTNGLRLVPPDHRRRRRIRTVER